MKHRRIIYSPRPRRKRADFLGLLWLVGLGLSGFVSAGDQLGEGNEFPRRPALSSGGLVSTALDDYIALEDPNYAYEHYRTTSNLFLGTKTYFLTMISQQWRSPEELDRHIWEHHVQIIVPGSLAHSTALQIVDGGNNTGSPPTSVDISLQFAARDLGMVIAVVQQVPNQPVHFADEGGASRSEDALIAYTFDKYLATRDPFWPALLPMTKAVVRSLDTVQAFLGNDLPMQDRVQVEEFIILGASKRGWASYLTAAVDSRIAGLIPISIDILNTEVSIKHHWEVYGFYTPAIGDYAAFDIFCRVKLEDHSRELLSIVDPYSYRSRLTMPKLIVNSAGDQFFAPTSSHFYFHDLPGENRLRYTVNTDHAQQGDPSVIDGVIRWLKDFRDNLVVPELSWALMEDRSLRVQSQTQPQEVRLWRAVNPDSRDFRLETLGPVWTSTVLQPDPQGDFLALPPDSDGFTAWMVEADFGEARVYTTDIFVTPDLLPFAGAHCTAATYFPQVADGQVGEVAFRTGFSLVNPGPESEVRLEFFSSDGMPMEVELGALGRASVFEFTLGEGKAFSVETPGTEAGFRVGYARMTGCQSIGGTAVFARILAPAGIILTEAGVLATAPHTNFSLFVDSIGEKDTGVAVVNTGAEAAEVHLRLYDKEFNLIGSSVRIIESGAHLALFVQEWFEEVQEMAREMEGVMAVESTQPLAALTLRTRDDPTLPYPQSVPILTAFPVVPGTAPEPDN